MVSLLTTFMVIMMILSFGISYVINSLGIMGCIKKAGEDGFKAWIPIYNEYLLYKISGMKGALITINIVAYISVALFMGLYVGAMSKAFDYMENGITNSSSYSTSSSKRAKNNTTYSTNDIYENQYDYNVISPPAAEVSRDYDAEIEWTFDMISDYITPFIILYCVVMVMSVALFVIRILLAINIAKAFDLGGGYIAGLILIPGIFLLIVAFGKCKYVGKYKTAEDVSM